MASTNLGCHLTFILQIYKSRATPYSSAWDNSMSNIGAVNQAPGAINHSPAATTLIGQKPNPWFNVLAAVVIVAGIIYTGIHLADDLSAVRDTRAAGCTGSYATFCKSASRPRDAAAEKSSTSSN